LTGDAGRNFENQSFRFEELDVRKQGSVNNYLKSPEEIEAEFSREMRRFKVAHLPFAASDVLYETDAYQDGYINTNPGHPYPGYMEENY
jgi:hypothetical protein